MPRAPIDEDRARRKALLEEKKAARRAAKELQENQKKEAAAALNKSSTTATSTGSATKGPCLLLTLPEDSIRVLFTCLSSADLGRLLLTAQSIHAHLRQARVAILLARLHHSPISSSPLTTCTAALDTLRLVTTQTQAQQLLQQLQHAGGTNTGRIRLPRNDATCNDFLSYIRFLEDAVHGKTRIIRRTTAQDNTNEEITLPRFVQGRIASASPEHSLVRASGVMSWGVGKRGQLGHGLHQDERTPQRLVLQKSLPRAHTRIVQVAAGGGLVRVAHSLLLTSTGHVYSFGTGQYGALGHGYSAAKQLPDVLQPKLIAALQDELCICVAAGELHSAVVTADGDVYCWGDGFCGQVGQGNKRPQLTPAQVTMGGLEDEVVASVTCGSRHTVAVTEEGQVYTWGLGQFGALGRSYTPFEYDEDTDAAAVVAGMEGLNIPPLGQDDDSNLAVDGQLAPDVLAHLDMIANLSLEDASDQCYPQLVEALAEVHIIGASAGHRHTLFLDQHGSLYSCGAGLAGCLGHGDTQAQQFPLRIAGLYDQGICIRQMSAGVDMSMAVSTEGHVYAWGRTDGGRIGLGNGVTKGHHVSLPRRVRVHNAQHDHPVLAVDVECGYVHSLIVGLDGTLHMCGQVGVEGEADGKQQQERGGETTSSSGGEPQQVENLNIWHRLPEPKEKVAAKEKWKKYGKYTVKGRSKMLNPE